MSAAPAPVVALAPVHPSLGAMSVGWARAVGAGSIRRDFGHHVASNAAGEVLIAARLERLDEGATAPDAAPAGELGNVGAGRSAGDAPAGRLIKLASQGGPVWSLLLRDAASLSAPKVALDDAGAAYVAGPYAPDAAGLCASREVSLTKLGPGGAVEWTRPLLLARLDAGRPSIPAVRVAADPAGGACVTWLGARRGSPVLRALRLSSEGSIEWEYAWPIAGAVFEPHVGVDRTGGAVAWGAFQGSILFEPRRAVRSDVEARYLARVQPDGRVAWSHVLHADRGAPCAVGVGRSGAINVATVVQSAARKGREPRRAVALLRSDAAGAPLKSLHAVCDTHALISSLHLASIGGDACVLAGSFAGVLHLVGGTLRSPTQAGEAVFVVGVGPDGATSALVLPVPQLWAGLSVHGVGDGAVLVAGWMCGAATFGEHKIARPRDRAVLFLAKLGRS